MSDSRWSVFDRVTVIRNTGYTDRTPSLIGELDRVGITDFSSRWTFRSPYVERLASVIPDARFVAQIGNFDETIFGMYAELKECWELGVERVLILEDDIRFLRDLSLLDEVLASVPDDFDSVKFSWLLRDSRFTRDQILDRPRINRFWISSYGFCNRDTGAIAFSRGGMKWMIDNYESCLQPGGQLRSCDMYDKPEYMPETYKGYLAVPVAAKQFDLGKRMSKVNLNSSYDGFLAPGGYDAYGSGDFSPASARDSVLAKSIVVADKKVVDKSVLTSRMLRCLACPSHERRWCPTCAGASKRIIEAFGGRRPDGLYDRDKASGVCTAHGAYELALASVDFGNDPIPESCPPSCWRRDPIARCS